ncbi:hypothetical protein B7C51_22965 [Paenibacillus larvae subsp. pulvifaciens]|uniref:Uncharacterized protein n=2 Tax=Paenibacillus larvae TaxID=1464 RepID=A0A1V0UY26_9BACL|nr:diadenylate cyclase domain-containing protein [Paenibacillus larvae]ARF70092.1 hypothetical protein B7C51_22965 [Paenibacillus larvae subsp. pulvifaciens]
MTKPNSDCDVSPMLINLKEDIKLIDVRIQKVLENFDDENHCLLGEFQSIFIDSERLEKYTEDPGGHRELMVQLWYPAKTGSDEPTAPYTANPKELASGLEHAFSLPAR